MTVAVRAVIFDLDDTLFDHRGSVRPALSSWLPEVPAGDGEDVTRAWFDLEREHYESWRAGRISFDEQRRRRIRDSWPHLGLRTPADDDLDALFGEYLTHYENAWHPFDDAQGALDQPRNSGFIVAVLTDGATAQQNAKVDKIGLRNHLTDVIT